MAGKLTERQEKFVAEYLIDLNATAAYKRAGYTATGHSAESAAARLLSIVEVKDKIVEALNKRQERTEINADNVLREVANLAHFDIGDLLDFSGESPRLKPANQIPKHARKAISSIKVKRQIEGRGADAHEVEIIEFKLWDKCSSLDKLGKHLNLWKESLDLNLKGPPFKVYLGVDPAEAVGPVQTSLTNDDPTDPAELPEN